MRWGCGLGGVGWSAVSMACVLVAMVHDGCALRGAVGRVRVRGKGEISVGVEGRIAWTGAILWLGVCWLGLSRGQMSLDQRLQVRNA